MRKIGSFFVSSFLSLKLRVYNTI